MMQGPWNLRRYVSSYLQWDLPRRLVGYRNLWQLDSDRLPTPVLYLPYEPPALDHWPTIITVAINTPSIERTDYTAGANPVYKVTYNMRTYIWVKQDNAEAVVESRDGLTTVTRAALLDRPCLVAGEIHDNHELLINEATMREEYSDITYVKGDRAVAGAYIAYDIQVNEAITRENLYNPSEGSPTQPLFTIFPLPRLDIPTDVESET